MLRKYLVAGSLLASAVLMALAAENAPAPATLSAAQIVERNVTARGGLQAWRAVQTLSESGKLGAGGDNRVPQPAAITPPKQHGKTVPMPQANRLKEEAQLPFLMELERPRKMRFEIQFAGKNAVQIYDGANGWKLRPYLNRNDVEPFTADELKSASMQTELDGPLMDYAAKGTRIELDGTEKVEDHDTYKLKLTLREGRVVHVWIDAKTFLEAKIEGQPRRLDGKMHPVEVYYRDYRSVSGLQFPFILETKVLPAPVTNPKAPRELPIPSEKITVEKIIVNPKLDASLFTKPQVQVATNHQPAISK